MSDNESQISLLKLLGNINTMVVEHSKLEAKEQHVMNSKVKRSLTLINESIEFLDMNLIVCLMS